MKEFPYSAMSSEELMALGEDELKDLPQKTLCELSYFVWAFYCDDPEVMTWRTQQLCPLIERDELLPLEEDWDG